MEEADLVIIGAGIFGLTTAHTYHRLHPSSKMLILDSSPSIGGPWAPQRIFPGLKTNNLLGMYEHPDFPMNEQKFRVKRGEHIDAANMFDYITAFVDWADIKQFIRLRTNVETIEKDEEGKGWILHFAPSSLLEKRETQIKARKLVIAVGTTNTPLLPEYPTSPNFRLLVVHARDFPTHYPDIVKSRAHTVVVGSGKSAWDVAYACATQPSSTATILIRPDGNGPVWMTPTHVTPLGLWLEKLVHTRFFGFMSPCPWAATSGLEGWLRSFFQRTWLGRKITTGFWNILGEDAIALNGLDKHPETKKLRPWRSAFEVGNALSIHNYPTSFFDLVRQGRIKVLIDDIAALQDTQQVLLKSGSVLQADAVVCATGWQKGYTFRFQPQELEKELGVPSSQPLIDEERSLVESAEETLFAQFPYLEERDTTRVAHPDATLRSTPQQPHQQQDQPYRLHRFITPPRLLQTRNIAFAGALHCLGSFPCAYIQALWITSFLDGSMALPQSPPSAILQETYRDTQYCVLRGAMSYGHTLPDLVFDTLPYFDTLLADLGVEGRGRRKGGALSECMEERRPASS
ncbi:flavin-binding monooxygenase-like protein [Stemphylium lycopersici]|uniref:FAD/NAD(P)-binding domain-containing protein n=1 Tax=Stemphylium lycopersici TaxID=183478 RepID=A0A364MWE1_STELY|nr:flavin-binding monooxygenase-like protein [Stemphylium lycopersici]RAR05361.1 FAD/NAD(P)-binding domain-containing protein [Stemphylium lycopersici]